MEMPASLEAAQKLRVVDLKEALKSLGLEVKGNKAELVERLTSHLGLGQAGATDAHEGDSNDAEMEDGEDQKSAENGDSESGPASVAGDAAPENADATESAPSENVEDTSAPTAESPASGIADAPITEAEGAPQNESVAPEPEALAAPQQMTEDQAMGSASSSPPTAAPNGTAASDATADAHVTQPDAAQQESETAPKSPMPEDVDGEEVDGEPVIDGEPVDVDGDAIDGEPLPPTTPYPTHHEKSQDPKKTQLNQRQKEKKKKRKRRQKTGGAGSERGGAAEGDDDLADIEIEYVPEPLFGALDEEQIGDFQQVFERFTVQDTAEPTMIDKEGEHLDRLIMANLRDADKAYAKLNKERMEKERKALEGGSDDEDEEHQKLSKKKLKKLNRMSVAELKQVVARPDLVEMWDVTSMDPKLLVYLKACRNTVPVPRHWNQKRKYLQNKRGIEKPPFVLPHFIADTGVMEMRAALQEKEEAMGMRGKAREKARPKRGKMEIDYQKLHDAFFVWQTKPRMSIHGDVYYENKENETSLKDKKPGDIGPELKEALGIPLGREGDKVPPPWLIAMQRYGPPPSYPNMRIRGLNAPIPPGCSFGYHPGGWGKPPVDEMGKPLYGDVFGTMTEQIEVDDEEAETGGRWGELVESEEESEESESESEEEEEEEEGEEAGDGTLTESGLATPGGITSIPAGLETPDNIELRKRKQIEEDMDQADRPALYTVIPEKRAEGQGAALMGSAHVYDFAGTKVKAPTSGAGADANAPKGIEVALDPTMLGDEAAIKAAYEQKMKETEVDHEDFSDMVAEHAARQSKKRKKKQEEKEKETKKFKNVF